MGRTEADRRGRGGGGFEKGHETSLALLSTPAKHPYPGPDRTHSHPSYLSAPPSPCPSPAWFTSVSVNYDAVLSARKAFISNVVLPAVSRGEDPNVAVLQHSQRGHNSAIASVWDPAAATVQVIDSVAYPGNPSCPFPAPHASSGPLLAAE